MLPQVAHAWWTIDEFLALPESHDHLEYVDGEVLLSPSPSAKHQVIVLELAGMLRSWCKQNPPASLGLSPLDLRLGPNRIVQPDLFVVGEGIEHDHEGPIEAVPKLVVEVLSQHRSYDRLTKRLMYAEAGIGEYWIVDPAGRSVEQVAHIETLQVLSEGTLSCRTLAGLAILIEELFDSH